MTNVHISLTDFRNESRILKEIGSLDSYSVFDKFCVIALSAKDLPRKERRSENFIIYRVNLCSRKLPRSAVFQLIKFVEFMFKCFFLIKREKATVVNLHTLALLPLGWVVKNLLGVRLVYDTHELETEKNGLRGMKKKLSKFVERLFLKSCDLIVVVGENIADWYATEYQIDRPIVVKNSPRLRDRFKCDLFRDELNISSQQKILLYQGGLMKGRGVQLILEAFRVRKSDDVVVVFMGYGDLEDEIKDAAKARSNIRFHPAVPPNIVLNYTSSADFGISLIENTCLSYFFCMPNKLFEYAMAGLPVIVSDMKEMAYAVSEHEFGTVIRDMSVDTINQAVDRLVDESLNELSEKAYLFARSHAWEVQEKVMLEAYRRMLKR